MEISSRSTGDFKHLEKFLDRMKKEEATRLLTKHAQQGVLALQAATPVDSGITASSWGYEIVNDRGHWTIWWTNDNVVDGFNVAVGLQYGHGTGTGGYVQGRDYINPALKAVFEAVIEEIWQEIKRS